MFEFVGNSSGRARLYVSVAAITLALGATASAQAQDAGAQVEEVVVTGTRIAGVAPVGSALAVVGAKDIAKYPQSNVVELLNRQPAFSGSGNNEAVKASNGPGAGTVNLTRGSDINLRGIGPNATLVLWDGARIPITGASGGSHDVSIIPQIAVDRIETVADGASAIYGSDAVAGVVNFVPRKSFNGLELRVQQTGADGYNKTYLGAVAGQQHSNWGWVVAIDYSKNDNLSGTERDYFKSDLRSLGGTDYRASTCNPGNLLVGGVSYALPVGGLTSAAQLVPNTANRCENFRLGDILPEQEVKTGYFRGTWDINPDVSIYFTGAVGEREFHLLDIIYGSQVLQNTVTVPRANPFLILPAGTSATATVQVQTLFDQRGLMHGDGHSRWTTFGTGASMKLPFDWKADLAFDYGRIDTDTVAIAPFATSFNPLLALTDRNTALNVFGGPVSDAVLANVFRSYYDPQSRNFTYDTRVNFNGKLFSLPGGDVKMAFGGQYFANSSTQINHLGDLNTLSTRTGVFLQFHRVVRSLFAEVYVPIVGAGNAMPLIQSLEITAAVRRDGYSDLGQTTNPKYGFNWKPVDDLKIRGSYGTSFIAPPAHSLYSPSSSSSINYTSAADPQSPTGTSQGILLTDNNPGVGPETATTWSVGAEYKPHQIPGLSLSATFFSIDYKDKITTINAVQALSNPLLSRFVTRNPTAAQVQALLATGLRIAGTPNPNPQFIVDQRPQNLGGLKSEGIDLMADYVFDTAWGQFDVGAVGTYNTKFEVSAIKGAPYVDQLNYIYQPLEFRGRGYLSWQRDALAAEVAVNYVNSYTNNNAAVAQKVDAYATFDARLAYDFAGLGSDALTKGLTASVQVQNLLDEDPPFVNVDGGVNFTASSPLGRTWSVSLTKRW